MPMVAPSTGAVRAPQSTRLREPGLWQRQPLLERHRLPGGGLLVVTLAAGDQVEVRDPEGRQAACLLAWNAQGRPTLQGLGLPNVGLAGADQGRAVADMLAVDSPSVRHLRQG